jgi:thermostable 8-oxoguanine DNA glycosylase
MRSKGVDAPAATPSGEKYLFLERMFLNLAQSEFPSMSIAQIDLLIWMKQSKRLEETLDME